MLKQPTKKTRKPGCWSELRQRLATVDKPALFALLKDLYEATPDNRDFIQARCQVGEAGGEDLEKYRAKIVEQFYPTRGEAKLKLSEARKAMNDYRKATGDIPGTAELMMTYVENGAVQAHQCESKAKHPSQKTRLTRQLKPN